MTTIAEAKDEMIGVFYTAWSADSESASLFVLYPNEEIDDDDTSADAAWARVTIKHFDNRFSPQSLTGGLGTKNYQRDGGITISIFTPIGLGADLGNALTKIVMDAFEGQRSGGVWFRNVRFNEVGKSGAWDQVNIKANFNYSEIK